MTSTVINLYSGPGCGKSTIAAETFAELKWRGIRSELALEYAKEAVWAQDCDHNPPDIYDQHYLFGQQHRRISRLIGKVDAIVTDSPLLLNAYYGKDCGYAFKENVIKASKNFDRLNVVLRRHKPFDQAGRLQNENEARKIDDAIEELLLEISEPFIIIDAVQGAGKVIADLYENHRKENE